MVGLGHVRNIYSHGLRSPWEYLNFSFIVGLSEVTVNLFEMKLDKLAQIIKSVEIAERSKYLKAKAAKAAKATSATSAPNAYRVAKSKPQPLRLKKRTAVDKLEYGKW